jgi:hypothetical protein
MSTNQEIMKVINEYIRVLPQNMKSNIDSAYKIKSERLFEYLTKETDMEDKKNVITQVVKEHRQIINRCLIAIKELTKIYKKRDISNIAGLNIEFKFKNPDPEGLIKKKKAGETYQIYRDIADLIKSIMDGDGDINNYVPSASDILEIKNWNNSFKYWQIFATLVNSLLSDDVDLTILKNVDVLDKYTFQPFKEGKSEKTQKKQGKKQGQRSKKSGQRGGDFDKGPRRDDRKDFKRDGRKDGRKDFKRDDRKDFKRDDRKDFKRDDRKDFKRDDRKDFKRDDKPYVDKQIDSKKIEGQLEETMKKIRIGDGNAEKNLWRFSEERLKDALFKKCKGKCTKNEFKIEFKDNLKPDKAIDPITGLEYTDVDLEPLMKNQNIYDKILKNLTSALKNIKPTEDKHKTWGNINNPQINEYKKYIEDITENLPFFDTGSFDEPKLKIQLSKEKILTEHITKKICDQYSIKVVRFLNQLRHNPIQKDYFYILRANIIKMLIGYYGYSLNIIGKFINDLNSRYPTIIQSIDFKANDQQKNRIVSTEKTEEMRNREFRNSIIDKFGNKERKILEKVDTIIAKLPPRSKEREIILKKRQTIVDMLVESKKTELKDLKNRSAKPKTDTNQKQKRDTNSKKKYNNHNNTNNNVENSNYNNENNNYNNEEENEEENEDENELNY